LQRADWRDAKFLVCIVTLADDGHTITGASCTQEEQISPVEAYDKRYNEDGR